MKIRLLSETEVVPIVAELAFSGSGVRDDFLADADCGPALRIEQQAFQLLERAECAEWELDVTLLEYLDAPARQSA